MTNLILIAGVILLADLVAPTHAYGYLDSGTISMFLQVVVAGAAGAFMFLKFGYARLRESLRSLFRKNSP